MFCMLLFFSNFNLIFFIFICRIACCWEEHEHVSVRLWCDPGCDGVVDDKLWWVLEVHRGPDTEQWWCQITRTVACWLQPVEGMYSWVGIVMTVQLTCNSPTHTHLFNGPLSGTAGVSRYQKGKTNLDFTEARDIEWQWHQLGHMQVCTSLQTDNHASTQFFTGRMPFLPPNQQYMCTDGKL